MTQANGRTAHHDIDAQFLHRWSPRAFTGEALPLAELMKILEAGRWAPSAFNGQPWRFVYALRDTPAWDVLLGLLIPYNQAWAVNAGALVFICSDRLMRREGKEPTASLSHSFDAGAAWGMIALQAHASGWAAHGMLGFDRGRAHEELKLPEDWKIEAAVAIGRQADRSVLPEAYREREVPSDRRPLSELVHEGPFT
ncbi:nitroreductase [Caulobacter ginsengisoli]|uniref:Nitroreductase n=1 Tax=Caulobacter ginsengisoli TaxID=400775 RepID=A0ABU0IQ81_9CAUL|nr:nitroreductase family protein [Caulobacter ginsengisoli]MDQ0464166.1 nitroreductase [Caulobacter ginsengisoli]